jgi:hypothetical protein
MKKKITLDMLEEDVRKLDVKGRDEFHTDLMLQEIPFWIMAIHSGREVDKAEIRDLVRRRGFNKSEAFKFRRLARWFNDHADELRAARTPESKHKAFMSGFEHGITGRTDLGHPGDPSYDSGFRAGGSAWLKARAANAKQLGVKIPRRRRIAGACCKKV